MYYPTSPPIDCGWAPKSCVHDTFESIWHGCGTLATNHTVTDGGECAIVMASAKDTCGEGHSITTICKGETKWMETSNPLNTWVNGPCVPDTEDGDEPGRASMIGGKDDATSTICTGKLTWPNEIDVCD